MKVKEIRKGNSTHKLSQTNILKVCLQTEYHVMIIVYHNLDFLGLIQNLTSMHIIYQICLQVTISTARHFVIKCLHM